jgi:hypothetical protein
METTLSKPRGWPLFLVGALFFLIGPVAYMVQINMGRLNTPWYIPILSTVGVGLMALSLVRVFGIFRTIGLAFFLVLCGLQWYMFAVVTLNPKYEGPARRGAALPEFTAKKADGTTFDNGDLKNGKATVLVFFRGHW